MTLKISDIAFADIDEIRAYIAADNEFYAQKTANEIYNCINDILLFPDSGFRLSNKTRRKNCYRYKIIGNYLIFYTIKNDIILVARVLQASSQYQKLLNE